MILKVAAGVFLGIVAVLILLNVPTWLAEYHESAASSKLFGLTPDAVIARCGKPLKDKRENFETTNPKEPLIERRLFYKGRFGETLAVQFTEFTANDGRRAWSGARVTDVTGFDHYTGIRNYNKDSEKIYALPCLDTEQIRK